MQLFENIRNRLKALTESVHPWSSAEDTVETSLELEFILDDAISLIQAIERAHHRWQQAILERRTAPEQQVDQQFTDFYESWLRSTDELSRQIGSFTNHELSNSMSTEFHNLRSELESTLANLSCPARAFRPLSEEILLRAAESAPFEPLWPDCSNAVTVAE